MCIFVGRDYPTQYLGEERLVLYKSRFLESDSGEVEMMMKVSQERIQLRPSFSAGMIRHNSTTYTAE